MHISVFLLHFIPQLETQQKEKKSSKYAGLEREAQRENQEFIEEQRDQVRCGTAISRSLALARRPCIPHDRVHATMYLGMALVSAYPL